MPLPTAPDTIHFGYLKIPAEVGLPILSGGDTGGADAGFKTHRAALDGLVAEIQAKVR